MNDTLHNNRHGLYACERSIRRDDNGAAELPQVDGMRGGNTKIAAQSRGIGGEGMSVIIEGLTLPKHNPKEIDKNVLIGYAVVKEDNTAELCLEGVRYLIKMLPTPHGRLIDADKLKCPLSWQGEIVRATVREAPTIIEAEVSEE